MLEKGGMRQTNRSQDNRQPKVCKVKATLLKLQPVVVQYRYTLATGLATSQGSKSGKDQMSSFSIEDRNSALLRTTPMRGERANGEPNHTRSIVKIELRDYLNWLIELTSRVTEPS
jgi:hypothetical protein